MKKKKIIIAIMNQKGGVGKTTSAINLAAAFGLMGYKTLLIDMDPQGSASACVRSDREPQKTVLDFLKDGIVEGKAVKSPHFDLIASDSKTAEIQGNPFINIEKDAIPYDITILDTPPSITTVFLHIMFLADYIIVPMGSTFQDEDGLARLMNYRNKLSEQYENIAEVGGIFFTRYNLRTNTAKKTSKEVKEAFGDMLLKSNIRQCIDTDRAQRRGLDIFEYSQKSKAALDYMTLAKEILSKIKKGK